jgi:glycosyltransferase involved in cell wall biosynthesis
MPQPVLLLIQSLGIGGTERQFSAIAQTLDRTRFEPHIGVLRLEGFRMPEIQAAGVPIVDLSVRSFLKPPPIPGAIRLIRYIRRNRIQLVHAFDAPTVLFGVPVAKAVGCVVISSQRSHRELSPGKKPLGYRRLMRLTDRMADSVVVNCEFLARHLIEDEKVPASAVSLCYNGVDTSEFRPIAGPKPAELAGAKVVIGIVSALRPEKNLTILLEAFAQARGACCAAKLLLVGSGASREGLIRQAQELGIAGDCVFAPATHDVAGWLRAIDIFVLPSTSEGLSNALMEAMACGCCAVASRVGGNPELVMEGKTGLLFNCRDAVELARALRLLVAEPELRVRLAQAGTQFIHEKFTLAASARRMGEIYNTVCPPEGT